MLYKSTLNKKIVIASLLGVALLTLTLVYYIYNISERIVQDYSPKHHEIYDKNLLLNSLEVPSKVDKPIELEKEQFNLPFRYWMNFKEGPLIVPLPLTKERKCGHFPNLFIDVKLHNTYWQIYQQSNIVYRLYGAYYDNRKIVLPSSVVRMLVLSNQPIGPFPLIYCNIWYLYKRGNVRKQTLLLSDIKRLSHWQGPESKIDFYPYMFTCSLPLETHAVPQAISLVSDYCASATNSLRVVYAPEKKPNSLALCLSNFTTQYEKKHFQRLLILQHSLGISQTFIYHFENNENVKDILQDNKYNNSIKLYSLSFGTDQPNTPLFKSYFLKNFPEIRSIHEIITYNDCFYRNMYKYNYIAMLSNSDILEPIETTSNQKLLHPYLQDSNGSTLKCLYETNSIVDIDNIFINTHCYDYYLSKT